ncbi:MAG: glutathione peroxidase [Candidatus Margulisbacteria bacterium]|nr:glutathione peroxidase [Candidatus Margulisiibacteriota bacterium]
MKSVIFGISAIIIIGVIFLLKSQKNIYAESFSEKNDPGIHQFQLTDITGKPMPLSVFKNNVVLIVNVASKCGFTSQYKELEDLYTKYKEKGFVVIGVPANNFVWQEPGSNKEIQSFCQLTYGVQFPMSEKVSVKGKDISPLYRYLTQENSNKKTQGAISWNFNKFLIDRSGRVYSRYASKTSPQSKEIIKDIESLL